MLKMTIKKNHPSGLKSGKFSTVSKGIFEKKKILKPPLPAIA